MNRLGMLIDLAHVTVRVMNQVLEMSEAPVIFSHSSAYGLCKHRRNVPDEVLLKVVSRPSANSPLLSRAMRNFIVPTTDHSRLLKTSPVQ